MSRRREEIAEEQVTQLRLLEKLTPMLECLHEVGCERDRAGNRKLFMDQYCLMVLMVMFNPIFNSLRALQQACELKKVQKLLGCPRASLGSLSEATQVFDAQAMESIVRELAETTQPVRDVSRGYVEHALTAVDGSVVKTLSTIAEAAYIKNHHGQSRSAWRLHTHFDIDHTVPKRIDVTPGSNGGKNDEKNVLREHLQADHCYVMDRWYAEYALFNQINAIGSSYVCRIRDNSSYRVIESRPLSEEARAAGVLSDEVVQLGHPSRRDRQTDRPVRLVCVSVTPRVKKRGGDTPSDGVLRIATNLLDPPAEIISEIYRQRWSVEVFFKFFKHVLGCRHLLSQDPVGIQIQVYCAVIACLLISLWTGRKPTLRTYEMISYYFIGLADEAELLAHIKKLKPHAD